MILSKNQGVIFEEIPIVNQIIKTTLSPFWQISKKLFNLST
jgi:hypothetical protein